MGVVIKTNVLPMVRKADILRDVTINGNDRLLVWLSRGDKPTVPTNVVLRFAYWADYKSRQITVSDQTAECARENCDSDMILCFIVSLMTGTFVPTTFTDR